MMVEKTPPFTICEACGNPVLYAHEAAWTDDGASFCKTCLPAPRATLLAERDRLRGALYDLVKAVGAMRVPQTTADVALQLLTIGAPFENARAALAARDKEGQA